MLAVTHHICFTFQPHRPNVRYYVANWSESPRDDEGAAIKADGAGGCARPSRAAGTASGRHAGTDVGGGFNC